jgi:Ca2+:H+ antiporter
MSAHLPAWTLAAPVAAAAALLGLTATGAPANLLWASGAALMLGAAVVAAVHHAEVVAHRVGEPFGSLVLALAVTVIEVALIVSLMWVGGEAAAGLARDTVFSALMIVCNGVVGLCLLLGGLRHRVLPFRGEGTRSILAVLVALGTLTLVLPRFTLTTPGPTFSPAQLALVSGVSLVLYGAFVFVQTVRHRDYFLPADDGTPDSHAEPPSARAAWAAVALLLLCLVGVVGLAKWLAPTIEASVLAAGAPQTLVGVIVALLVLLPETLAAVRAALANRMQTSLNLALGSGVASIALTIPAVALLSPWLPYPLVLGLSDTALVLFALTAVVSTLTLSNGRANVLQGAVHLVIFAVFCVLAVVP